VGSIVGLALRSPLEQMQRGATYARLRANPADTQALEDLRLDWTAAAKRAKRRRFTQAGLQLGAGAILIAVSSARLAASGSDTTSSEQVWAFTTLASAIGLTLAGIPTFILPSATERSLATYEAARAPAKPSVLVAPTLGGLAVSGRF